MVGGLLARKFIYPNLLRKIKLVIDADLEAIQDTPLNKLAIDANKKVTQDTEAKITTGDAHVYITDKSNILFQGGLYADG